MLGNSAGNGGKQELVSIVTPMFNAQKFIRASIQSVRAQTYQNWELIIADDCSTDDSRRIVREFARADSRIKLLALKKNSGVAAARNTAIRAARGRFIAFLDSDDLWQPYKLERHIAFMRACGAKFSYTAYNKFDEHEAGDVSAPHRMVPVPERVGYPELLRSNVIGCSTVIYDTHAIPKHYMRSAGHEDYILWLKLLKKYGIAHGLNQPLTAYRVRADSVSGKKLKAARFQWHIYQHVEKLPLWKSVIYFLSYAYRGYRKFAV